MARFYSNHYGPQIGETGHFTTRTSPPNQVKAGFGHSRLRHKFCNLIVPAAQDLGDNDEIRLFDFKSSDRLLQIFCSMDANWGATTTFNIGLYLKGDNDDGAVVDEDLFASAVDWSGAIARVDYFKEATTLDDWDRGKMLWELVNIGIPATYTEDPGLIYSVACTTTQDISATAAAVEFSAEAIYLSND